jgi:hypothetical protein
MSTSNFCPVPKEQQPINEYQELQESWFFSWGKLPLSEYIGKLVWIAIWSQFVVAPVAAASFPIARYPIQFTLFCLCGGLIMVALAVIRLYLGWIYIRDRLQDETVFYEESGWYDGQTWAKTPEILDRDRLVVSYEIQPILHRVKLTLAMITGTILGAILTLLGTLYI